MNRTNIFFGESHSDWLPVRGGESGDFVFRRGDGHAFAKIAPASRRGELAGERDRLIWLKGRGVACPEVINWQEEQEGACLVITAIPGVPAADLSGADLLKAWPSMGQQLGAVHSLSVDQCPFERRLSRMFGRAVDVVSGLRVKRGCGRFFRQFRFHATLTFRYSAMLKPSRLILIR
ncbi:phosphotransferase [Corynebacterium macclintockiae]|uniref:phosphotransferase n=1 Tax=Corynebacterium macclintockiae TaxID=2913501 RepID=UPI003EB7541A